MFSFAKALACRADYALMQLPRHAFVHQLSPHSGCKLKFMDLQAPLSSSICCPIAQRCSTAVDSPTSLVNQILEFVRTQVRQSSMEGATAPLNDELRSVLCWVVRAVMHSARTYWRRVFAQLMRATKSRGRGSLVDASELHKRSWSSNSCIEFFCTLAGYCLPRLSLKQIKTTG